MGNKESKTPASCPLSFYNIDAHIKLNQRLKKENIAVRGIWQKGDNTYFKVYFYSTKETKALDAHFIYDLYDKNTEHYYKDIKQFVAEYQEIMASREKNIANAKKSVQIEQNFTTLQTILPEIIILMFFTLMRTEMIEVKLSVVKDFIKKHQPQAAHLSEQYIEAFIRAQTINVDAFYKSMEQLIYHDENILNDLLTDVVKISATDGAIHYIEKLYIAEIMQFYRDKNIRFSVEV